jgi:hypothetical protein
MEALTLLDILNRENLSIVPVLMNSYLVDMVCSSDLLLSPISDLNTLQRHGQSWCLQPDLTSIVHRFGYPLQKSLSRWRRTKAPITASIICASVAEPPPFEKNRIVWMQLNTLLACVYIILPVCQSCPPTFWFLVADPFPSSWVFFSHI